MTFMPRQDSCPVVRFVRVTYTRPAPQSTQPDEPLPVYPEPAVHAGFAYKTFLPAPVKVGMCSGSPEYECATWMWERSKAWLTHCGQLD